MTRPRRSRTPIVVALLGATLVLSALLAHQAQDAAHSHRATAERALQDYADFAALGFATHAKDALYSNLEYAALWVAANEPRYPGEERPFGHRHALRDDGPSPACVADDPSVMLFRVDLRTGAVATRYACTTPALRRWLADTVAVHARTEFQKKWKWAEIFGDAPDQRRLVAYLVDRDTSGVPVVAYGFSRSLMAFTQPRLRNVLQRWQLLPASLTGGAPNDSLLSVVVTDMGGREMYRSAAWYPSTFTGHIEQPDAFGGLKFHVTLRPDVAGRLVIGGLPRSRLPLLLGLFALAAGLVVVAILQLRREAELNRLRSDFISNVSHELRTPLAQIRMFAETLLLGRVRSPEEGRRSLQILDQEARRLTHLVENVLQFSRAERRSVRLSPERTELAAQLRETLETFAPLARARQVTVREDLRGACEAVVDRGALRQILLNLLDNAVKYGPMGQTVTVGLSCAAERGRLWVDDQGPGVPPAERARVWEPFYRCDGSANSAIAGSGIGLAVVRELVELHGGRVWVEDAPAPPGEPPGARFVVELPIVGSGERRAEGGVATPGASLPAAGAHGRVETAVPRTQT